MKGRKADFVGTRGIGIVIIGRNEGHRLVSCLESVNGKSTAVVYVDSGSTDESVRVARKAGALVVELDLSVPFTAARARNSGYCFLKSAHPHIEFVQFIDGDCEIHPEWIDTAAIFIGARKDVAVVCGRRRERFPDASIYNRLCDGEWDTPVGEATACGGDSLVRCAAFDRVDGFNSALICGEEPELCVRLREAGWEIWRIDSEMTLHDAAIERFSQWWQRCVRTGYGFAEVSRLHRASRFGIWRTETIRAIVWGGIVPFLVSVGALIDPMALTLLAIYPLQVARIALRDQSSNPGRLSRAAFLVLGKFPELQGVLAYYWRQAMGRTSTLIEYKTGT